MHFRFFLFLILICPLPLAADSSDRVEWLRAEIARHDQLYWEALSPEITDEAYDALVAELVELSGEKPEPWVEPSSPENRRPHRVPMLSLNKLHSSQEWQNFVESIHRQVGLETPLQFRLEPKYDGVAISLVYRNGYFQYALTRGDGSEGIVVTSAVRMTAEPPSFLPLASDLDHLEIRGELYADAAQFASINRQRIEAGEDPYAQPRHLVAATLRMHDLKQVAQRSLSFVAFDSHADSLLRSPTTQSQIIATLADWGFAIPDPTWEQVASEQVLEHVQAFARQRSQLGFPTDGLVIKLECRATQQQLSSTQRAPRWAAAWKYPGTRVASRILEIVESVGETGRITPVARIEPIEIEGIQVKRISLHSPTHRERMGYAVGQRIAVHLAGGVIPAIAKALED